VLIFIVCNYNSVSGSEVGFFFILLIALDLFAGHHEVF